MTSIDRDPVEDREICLCFHVNLVKLVNFALRHQPKVASQFAQCNGAGTGCGWCVPYLESIHEQFQRGETPRLRMSNEEYRERRQAYHQTKRPELPPPPEDEEGIERRLEQYCEDLPEEFDL